MSNTSITLVDVNGEPRIRDIELAERLGFADPRMIRKLIARNAEKLKQFSILSTVEIIHEGAGRPHHTRQSTKAGEAT